MLPRPRPGSDSATAPAAAESRSRSDTAGYTTVTARAGNGTPSQAGVPVPRRYDHHDDNPPESHESRVSSLSPATVTSPSRRVTVTGGKTKSELSLILARRALHRRLRRLSR